MSRRIHAASYTSRMALRLVGYQFESKPLIAETTKRNRQARRNGGNSSSYLAAGLDSISFHTFKARIAAAT